MRLSAQILEIQKALLEDEEPFNKMVNDRINAIIMSKKIVVSTCYDSQRFIDSKFWRLSRDFQNSKDRITKIPGLRVIVDEAAQALEPQILIPILAAEQIVLVGDHQQLGPVYNGTYNNQGGKWKGDELEEEK